jgi:hypothetical protein
VVLPISTSWCYRVLPSGTTHQYLLVLPGATHQYHLVVPISTSWCYSPVPPGSTHQYLLVLPGATQWYYPSHQYLLVLLTSTTQYYLLVVLGGCATDAYQRSLLWTIFVPFLGTFCRNPTESPPFLDSQPETRPFRMGPTVPSPIGMLGPQQCPTYYL